jgi:hypothetical protein
MNYLSLFFICTVSLLQAQTYQFDYLFHYQYESYEAGEKLAEFHKIIYKGKNNNSCYLVFSPSQNKTIIYDFKNDLRHHLDTKVIEENQEVRYDFSLIKTEKLNQKHYFNWKNYDKLVCDWLKIGQNESGQDILQVIIYKNSKRKKIIKKVEFLVENSSENHLDVFTSVSLHGLEFNPLITSESPILIKSAKWEGLSGQFNFNCQLKAFQHVDFKILIPPVSSR